MVPDIKQLTLADVHDGDELPPLAYDVTATTVVLGALGGRDWRPMHHDHDFAVNRNGTQDIFLNTPNQAAWFERYLTDWTGPNGRLGRMKFRMRGSVFPGDTMVFAGRSNTSRPTTPAAAGPRCRHAVGRRRDEDRLHRADRAPGRGSDNPGPAAATRGSRDHRITSTRSARYMDLDFTEEQEMLREMVRGVCGRTRRSRSCASWRTTRSATRPSSGSSSPSST